MGTSAKKATVLIIDDEQSIVDVYKETLKRAGFNVRVLLVDMSNSNSALDIIADLVRTHGISCVITDYNMPGINGIQIIEMLRKLEEKEGLPMGMVLSTGEPSADLILNCIKYKVHFLVKPVSIATLQKVVRQAIS